MSPSSRRAWIEITLLIRETNRRQRSPSSRRAWIEINGYQEGLTIDRVALLAEGVDRNTLSGWKSYRLNVALLAEGVDRNRTQTR